MAENNLNNDPNVSNFLSSLNAVFSALRGTFAPRNNAGNVGDGAADLGSSTNSWARAYIQTLIVGGVEVDLASVAVVLRFSFSMRLMQVLRGLAIRRNAWRLRFRAFRARKELRERARMAAQLL